MLSAATFKVLGILFLALGVFGCALVWRYAITGITPPDSSSGMPCYGPFLAVVGVVMLIFRPDQIQTPASAGLRIKMTLLGWGLFVLALAAGIGNYILMVQLAQSGR